VQIEASASHARDGGSFALTHRPSPRHRQATLDQSEHNDLAGWFGADWKFTNPAATRVVPTRMDDSTDRHGRKLHHGFPGFKTDFTDCSSAPIPLPATSPDDALCDGTPVGVRHEELPEVVPKERSSGLVGRGVASAHGADP